MSGSQTPKPTPKKGKPNASGQAKANAALLAASIEGDLLGVRMALSSGADVNVRDKEGRTPLMRSLVIEDAKPDDMAAWERSLKRAGEAYEVPRVAQTLLRAGAQINLADNKGWTALIYAVLQHNRPLCEELIRRKANVNHRTKSGPTALAIAVIRKDVALVNLLLNAGADIRRHGMEGQFPLLAVALMPRPGSREESEEDNVGSLATKMASALFGGSGEDTSGEEVVERLLRAGLDPNETGKDGVTSLMIAAGLASPRLVRRLIERGAKVDATHADGGTALFAAASEGRGDNTRVLLGAGARLDVVNKTGSTPLIWATLKGSYSVVEQLLAAGAKPEVRNNDGHTARDVAVEQRYTALIRLFDSRTLSK